MGIFDRFKKKTEARNEFLLFDNYPFKLAVIQQLMYEQEALGSKYNGGDRYFETYTDVAEVSEEESINRLKPYIEQGNLFFSELNIPCSLAIRQFPKLKAITFNMYHEPPEELVNKIESWGIEVNLQD